MNITPILKEIESICLSPEKKFKIPNVKIEYDLLFSKLEKQIQQKNGRETSREELDSIFEGILRLMLINNKKAQSVEKRCLEILKGQVFKTCFIDERLVEGAELKTLDLNLENYSTSIEEFHVILLKELLILLKRPRQKSDRYRDQMIYSLEILEIFAKKYQIAGVVEFLETQIISRDPKVLLAISECLKTWTTQNELEA